MQEYEFFSFEKVGSVFVVRLRNSELLDPSIFVELARELSDFVSRQHPPVVVLTFEYVRRFSSDVINVLLMIRERLVSSGGRLMLCEMRQEIQEVFTILHLDFETFPTLNEALDVYEAETSRV